MSVIVDFILLVLSVFDDELSCPVDKLLSDSSYPGVGAGFLASVEFTIAVRIFFFNGRQLIILVAVVWKYARYEMIVVIVVRLPSMWFKGDQEVVSQLCAFSSTVAARLPYRDSKPPNTLSPKLQLCVKDKIKNSIHSRL